MIAALSTITPKAEITKDLATVFEYSCQLPICQIRGGKVQFWLIEEDANGKTTNNKVKYPVVK